jgi:hypothetical protein
MDANFIIHRLELMMVLIVIPTPRPDIVVDVKAHATAIPKREIDQIRKTKERQHLTD